MRALFDAHSDLLWLCDKHGCSVNDESLAAAPQKGKDFSPYFQIYALFTDRGGLDALRRMLAIGKAELNGSFCYSIEGAEGINCDPALLPEMYEAGVRSINLCWNYDNELTGSVMGSAKGLTEKGRAFVAEMERLGIFVDVSHISDTAFWDVIECSTRPVIASHSDSRAMMPMARNLTDGMFTAIAESGGVVGLNYCDAFVGGGQDIEALVDHAEHFLSLGGEKHLGLGSDFDGCDTVKGLADLRDMDALYEAMLRRNWPEELVRDVFFNNFGRLFDEYTDIRPFQVL